jgi:hypothetical protein
MASSTFGRLRSRATSLWRSSRTRIRRLNRRFGQPVKQLASGLWHRAGLYSVVALVAIGLLGWYLFTNAFADRFTCRYLIVDQLGAEPLTCDGFDVLPSSAKSTLDRFGIDIDSRVPGLGSVVDGPLEFLRKLSLGAALAGLVVISAFATYVMANVQKFVRLVRLDPQQWARSMETLRTFATILLVLMVVFWLFARSS